MSMTGNSVEDRIGKYVSEVGVNHSKMARDIGVPYISLYNSLNSQRNGRELRTREYIAVCKYLNKSLTTFADEDQIAGLWKVGYEKPRS